jgi:hypothetical protein
MFQAVAVQKPPPQPTLTMYECNQPRPTTQGYYKNFQCWIPREKKANKEGKGKEYKNRRIEEEETNKKRLAMHQSIIQNAQTQIQTQTQSIVP